MRSFLLFVFVPLSLIQAAPMPLRPSTPRSFLMQEQVVEGGKKTKANVEGIRFGKHPGFERWVVDFSDAAHRKVGSVSPLFQVRFEAGKTTYPARIILSLRSIERCFLTENQYKPFLSKSSHVDQIVVHPQIEGGDMAIEFILKHDLNFKAHEPKGKAGRVVIDLLHGKG